MRIKKCFVVFLIVFLAAFLGYFCLSLNARNAVVSSQQAQTANRIGVKQQVILYEQQVGDLADEQVNIIWPSNNPRSWILTGVMDGEIVSRYKAWENKYMSQVAGTKDTRGLKNNTDLTVCLKNLNIKVSDYQDIRVQMDYISNGGASCLVNANSLEVFALDTQNKKYGPFFLQYTEHQGFYMRTQGTTKRYDRGFVLTTEQIKASDDSVITELEIKPYANYPTRHRVAEKAGGKNWRGREALTFALSGIKVLGYRNTDYKRPSYVRTKKINVDSVREQIVQRMYDQATVKWSPTVTFTDTHARMPDGRKPRAVFEPGQVYYGLPYTQRNRVTVEKFASEIRDGKLAAPEELFEVWGADCVGTVDYSLSKYIPLPMMNLTPDFIWDRNHFKLLGNLKIDGTAGSSSYLKNKYSPQEIYEAYAQLQKGDVTCTHWEKGAHARLISGNTHVVRNWDGIIDPVESYFIITEISSNLSDTKVKNNFGGLLTSEDYVVPFKPDKRYTDIKNLSELADKNSNFRVNKKVTFKQAYDGCYAPLTPNVFITGEVEVPYARIINPNTAENIKNGFKGTICSNYTIISIKYQIKNRKTGEAKVFIEYPNHSSGTLEGRFTNSYSLYYNTPAFIQNYLKETLKNTDKFEVSVSVTVGENENMEVLKLSK